jgi:sulfur relay (sulfurtransferase) DsrC/TusE family protein
MVTQKSATSTGLTAVANENNISLNTDHSRLVKYESRNQEEYNIVKEKLKILVAEAKQEVGQRFTENST